MQVRQLIAEEGKGGQICRARRHGETGELIDSEIQVRQSNQTGGQREAGERVLKQIEVGKVRQLGRQCQSGELIDGEIEVDQSSQAARDRDVGELKAVAEEIEN